MELMIIRKGTRPDDMRLGIRISINNIERSFYDIYLHHKPLSSQSRSHLFVHVYVVPLTVSSRSAPYHPHSKQQSSLQSDEQLSTNKDPDLYTDSHHSPICYCFWSAHPQLCCCSYIPLHLLVCTLGELCQAKSGATTNPQPVIVFTYLAVS